MLGQAIIYSLSTIQWMTAPDVRHDAGFVVWELSPAMGILLVGIGVFLANRTLGTLAMVLAIACEGWLTLFFALVLFINPAWSWVGWPASSSLIVILLVPVLVAGPRALGYDSGGRAPVATWRRQRQPDRGWVQAPGTQSALPEGPKPTDPFSRLPPGARTQVEAIRSKAWALLQRSERLPASSESLYLVRRTLDEYLPATVNTYLALPPGADNWPVAPDGRTGLQVLREQLHILDGKLDEIAADLWRHDVERLLANGRFLDQRFGPPRSDELLP